MEIYKGIVKRHKDEEEIAAKAQYRIAECWEKLGVERDAREAYEALVRDFPSQTALVDKAKVASSMKGNPIALTDVELTEIAMRAMEGP